MMIAIKKPSDGELGVLTGTIHITRDEWVGRIGVGFSVDRDRKGRARRCSRVEVGLNAVALVFLILMGLVIDLLWSGVTYFAVGKDVVRSPSLMSLEVLEINKIRFHTFVSYWRWKRIYIFIRMGHGTVIVDTVLG